MKSFLLTLSILILTALTPIYSHGADCQGKVVNTNLGSLSWNSPTINRNSTLRIFIGTKEGEVVDIFTSNHDAFTGFNTTLEQVDDKDLRNWLIRKLFPKDLKPSEYYINFHLTEEGMETVKLKRKLQLTLSIRISGQTRNANFIVDSNPSWNCK